MAEIVYGRLRDLGGLPDLVKSLAGEEGLYRVFQEVDLPVELLAVPDTPVPMRDLVALYHRAAEITGMRSFGLKASADINVERHGLVGNYIRQARDLPHALARFRTVLPYHENGSSLDIETVGNELLIGYRNTHQRVLGWRHAGDFTLCVIADVISGYLGTGWQPLRIETCYAKGPWEQDNEDQFDAPVQFNSDRIAIVLDRETVTRCEPPRVIEPGRIVSLAEVRRMGKALPEDYPHAVANIIERRLINGNADLDGTASTLGLGPRTLQRRLNDHGLSYRDLVLYCRMRRARELLVEPEITVLRVGQEVGYASTPQFTRAFKEFFGTTPREFRNSFS